MNTISAKELRDNLSQVFDRVENGEDMVVIRRSKPSVRLTSAKVSRPNTKKVLKSIERYHRYRKAAGIKSSFDPNKSYKELRDELYAQHPKYGHYLTPSEKRPKA